jgi:hypothetical protein
MRIEAWSRFALWRSRWTSASIQRDFIMNLFMVEKSVSADQIILLARHEGCKARDTHSMDSRFSVAGFVLVRQKPGPAKGVVSIKRSVL